MTKNYLTMTKSFDLAKWLKANKKKIEEDGLNIGETATLAEKQLEFIVHERNIKTIIESAGINIKFPRRGSRKTSSELSNKLDILVHELKLFWQEMGYNTTKPFKDIFGE